MFIVYALCITKIEITIMTEAAPPDVKRRRLSAANNSPQGIRRLTDLPTGILSHAASFLAAPSKALFAIALDENSATTSSPNDNDRSSAIVGNECDTLDFGQIEKDLSVKLSDLDIERVLLCVDAVNKVNRLKLTNCTNITGTCLEPLRGSAVIEQIDLSLVGDTQQTDVDLALISLGLVLPILDSIIEREGRVLKYLQFPSVWRKEPSADSEFHAFLLRYDEMRRNRETVTCLECNAILPVNGAQWIKTDIEERRNHYYGIHLHTCYDCLKNYCYDCEIEDDEEEFELGLVMKECGTCQRDYCKGCAEMTYCGGCSKDICHYCYKCKCVEDFCSEDFCSECVKDRKNVHKCEYCDKCYCLGCHDDEEVDIIYTCSRCDVKCCEDCRLQRYQEVQLNCAQCINGSYRSLERKQLQDEVKQLKVEMEELKRQIEELKLENEELRSKLT